MAEYIDKHEAYLLLKDLEAAYIYPPVKEAYATAARRIDQMKAADVHPIKRGKWEENAGYGGWGDTIYQCSECNIEFTCETGIDIDWNYCPNCGARMDAEPDEPWQSE